MENTTLEEVEAEENKRLKKDFLLAVPYLALALGSGWVMFEGLDYLQMKTFSSAESIITTTNSSFLYALSVILISFFIIPSVCEFIFRNPSKITVKEYMKRILPIIIPSIPIIYMSFYSYLDIGKDSISYDPFWPGEKEIYLWEDIQSVVIDKASYRNKRFDYYVYFKDGTKLDIWGDTRMNIGELKQVDDIVRARGIPKYINEPPYEKGLEDNYGDNPEEYKMVQQIISE
jgi:hypothetical protein